MTYAVLFPGREASSLGCAQTSVAIARSSVAEASDILGWNLDE